MSDLVERLRRIAHPNSTEGRVAMEAVRRIEELENVCREVIKDSGLLEELALA